jgi:hypothetical protein
MKQKSQEIPQMLIKDLISERKIIVDRDKLFGMLKDIIDGENVDVDDALDTMIMKNLLNVENITPEEETETYVVLPRNIELSKDELLFCTIYIKTCQKKT